MDDKTLTELIKVVSGKKYTKNWNFWARLARADIVKVHGKDRVEKVTLTDNGRRFMPDKRYWHKYL